jgi:hypothetical protein
VSAAARSPHTAHTAPANPSAAQADAAAEALTTGVMECDADTVIADGGGFVGSADGDVAVPRSNCGGGTFDPVRPAADDMTDVGHVNLVSDEVTSFWCHLQSLGPV